MADTLPLRITSGEFGGRWIESPVNRELRPTRDAVREAMFGMVESIAPMNDLVVWDLFCGSGALGIEAISRGAAECFFVDTDVQPVVNNLRTLGIKEPRALVKRRNALSLKKAPQNQATPNIIFADPPYDLELARKLLEKCYDCGDENTLWVIETEASEKLDKYIAKELAGQWEILRDRVYGANRVWILQRIV